MNMEHCKCTAMESLDHISQIPMSFTLNEALSPRSSRPNFGHLVLLVFEAVLEVVCVSLPGYIVARRGMFNQEMQKFVANLNVILFTPCLSMFGSCLAKLKLI